MSMDKTTFINTLTPFAKRARKEGSALFVSVRIAQNLLETGGTINAHNNLGGFKVGAGKPNGYWKGETYTTPTWEMIGGKRIETEAEWRSYDSIYDFYKDQDILFHKPRYARLLAAITPEDQCRALYECGYATDENYSSKLIAQLKVWNLKSLDKEDYDMTVNDANKIIEMYLKPAYSKSDTDAARKEIGRLADELRKASNQPTQNK